MQNWMLEFSLDAQLQVELLEFSTKEPWVIDDSIHVFFNESNNFIQRRYSLDDDLGLKDYMGRLQIVDERQ